jgi:integral membrane protein (TIGR01906 family)
MSTTAVAPDAAVPPAFLAGVRALLSLAFVLALPLLVIATNLRSLVTDRDYLLGGFRNNQVSATTGLDQRQLEGVADAFVAYFQAPAGRMDVQVDLGGQRRPLFNERELAHMEDVQALVHLFLRLQLVAAAIVVARAAFALLVERSPRALGLDMLWSTALVVALVATVGALSVLDFGELWTRFHKVAFRNELWQLDPRHDYLIMLFPEPFWFAATMRMAVGTAVVTLLLGMVGFFAWRFGPPAQGSATP